MSATSAVHILLAVGSLLLGLTIFFGKKGGKRHRYLGWAYVIAMLLSIAAIMTKKIASMTPFAWLTLLVAAVVVAAVVVARRKPGRTWRGWHGSMMGMTFAVSTYALLGIILGVSFGESSGPGFYKLFNTAIAFVTIGTLLLVWRSKALWLNTTESRSARLRVTALFASSSIALSLAQSAI